VRSEAQYTHRRFGRKGSRDGDDDCFAAADAPPCEAPRQHGKRSPCGGGNEYAAERRYSGGTKDEWMRLILRIAGTWLIGLALVLLVVDGTKSLGANGLVMTTLSELWLQLHPPSLEGMREFFETRFFAALLHSALEAVLGYPAFAVIGIPGIVLALLGRKPRRERYLRADQF
jgi:hypothetical protein